MLGQTCELHSGEGYFNCASGQFSRRSQDSSPVSFDTSHENLAAAITEIGIGGSAPCPVRNAGSTRLFRVGLTLRVNVCPFLLQEENPRGREEDPPAA